MRPFKQITREEVEQARRDILRLQEHSEFDTNANVGLNVNEYRDMVITIQNLYNHIDSLERQNTNLGWKVNPDRMGS